MAAQDKSTYSEWQEEADMSDRENARVGRGFAVKVYRTYFLESEVVDGDYMGAPNTSTYVEEYTDMHAVDVARMCMQYGLSFEYADWAYQVDGSVTVNYETGERMEITLHLGDDCPVRVANAIREVIA